MDLRTPKWLDDKLMFAQNAISIQVMGTSMVDKDAILVDDVGHAGMTHRQQQRDDLKQANKSSCEEICHDCWSVLFQPSPPVAALIEESLKRSHLIPGDHTSVHIRSLCLSNQPDNIRMTHEAVNLACSLRPGAPVCVAADSKKVSRTAVKHGCRTEGGRVVARMDRNEPLHID
jgi:hypothetical protein